MPLQRDGAVQEILGPGDDLRAARRVVPLARRRAGQRVRAVERVVQAAPARIGGVQQEAGVEDGDDQLRRSEEHTSELQSLMRISYAVFCLKKKKTNTHNRRSTRH